ncbi:WecB/TagA/CpsF family glycosyltransferase [Gordonia polyisoprenivorans]
MESDEELQEIAASADCLIPDGWPVARWLSARSGRAVQRVAGSDVFDALLDRLVDGTNLTLVGGDSLESLDRLSARAQSSGWDVSCEPAPRGEVDDQVRRASLIQRLSERGGVIALGLGAPKQERLASEISGASGGGWIMCVGMSLNFSAGSVQRAPDIARRLKSEWVYRALSEPSRLGPRYIADLIYFLTAYRRITKGCHR